MAERHRIAFYDTKPYDRDFFDKHLEGHDLEVRYFESRLSRESVDLCDGYDAVCLFVNDVVDQDVAAGLANNGVKLVALRCAGYNNIDFGHLDPSIKVVRVPAYSPNAVAEFAVTLMMTLNRKTHRAYYRTRDNNFSLKGLLGCDMNGKTVGVIGTGRIGKLVAQILKGIGMVVLAEDVYPDEEWAREQGVRYVTKTTLYQQSDFVTLHCPLTDDNIYMINRGSLSQMKPTAIIVNTGRGKLINTVDLLDALKNHRLGGAALDVYEEEEDYFFEDYSTRFLEDDVLARLLTFPNVLVTSHQAFFTEEALSNIAETTIENIEGFFLRDDLPNEVNP